jgi:hypothetical protein
MEIFIELAIIFVLVLANGFFAASELAVMSSRRSRLEDQANARKSGADKALILLVSRSSARCPVRSAGPGWAASWRAGCVPFPRWRRWRKGWRWRSWWCSSPIYRWCSAS